MPDTGLGKYRYDNSSDDADGPGQALRLAEDVARNVDPVPDAAARTAISSAGKAVEEMHVMQQDTKVEYVYRSATWVPWNSALISYTPTVTGPASLGAGATTAASYQYVNGRVRVKGRITLGTAPNMTAAPILTLPMTFATTVRYAQLGLERCYAFDVSAASTPVAFIARHDTTSYDKFTLQPWSGTAGTTLNTSTPFSWQVSDTIDFDLMGDPA